MESLETSPDLGEKRISQIGTDILGLSPTSSECKYNLTNGALVENKYILDDLECLSSSLEELHNDFSCDDGGIQEKQLNKKYYTDSQTFFKCKRSLTDNAAISEETDIKEDTESQEDVRNILLTDNWEGKTLSNENMSITSWDENVLDEYLSSIDINEPFLYDCIAVSIKTYRSYTKNSFFHDPHHNESIYTPIMSEYNRGILENSDDLSISSCLGDTKRGQAIIDLYKTEKNFVDDLKTFIKDVKDYCCENNVLNDSAVEVIFGACKEIYDVHNCLFDNLKLLLKPDKWNPQKTCVGFLFLYYMDQFTEVHSKFIDSYAIIQRLIRKEERHNLKYQAFSKLMLRSHALGRRQIKDFLILPIQRMPRYRMILKDLIKLTPNEHPDKCDIERSLESISALVSVINEKKRAEEGATGLFEAYELTRNCPPTFISSSRSLVYSCKVLDVVTNKICKLFLCTDSLVVAQKYNKYIIQLQKDKENYLYKFDKWIDLREILLSEVNRNSDTTILRLKISNDNKSHDSVTYPKNIEYKDLLFQFSFDNGAKDRLELINLLETQIKNIKPP